MTLLWKCNFVPELTPPFINSKGKSNKPRYVMPAIIMSLSVQILSTVFTCKYFIAICGHIFVSMSLAQTPASMCCLQRLLSTLTLTTHAAILKQHVIQMTSKVHYPKILRLIIITKRCGDMFGISVAL